MSHVPVTLCSTFALIVYSDLATIGLGDPPSIALTPNHLAPTRRHAEPVVDSPATIAVIVGGVRDIRVIVIGL